MEDNAILRNTIKVHKNDHIDQVLNRIKFST